MRDCHHSGSYGFTIFAQFISEGADAHDNGEPAGSAQIHPHAMSTILDFHCGGPFTVRRGTFGSRNGRGPSPLA
jgi:hypothetical protein